MQVLSLDTVLILAESRAIVFLWDVGLILLHLLSIYAVTQLAWNTWTVVALHLPFLFVTAKGK